MQNAEPFVTVGGRRVRPESHPRLRSVTAEDRAYPWRRRRGRRPGWEQARDGKRVFVPDDGYAREVQ